MSDNILEADDAFEQADDVVEATNEVGMSSQEASDSAANNDSVGSGSGEKKSFLKSFTVFDGLLLISLICVSLATLFLFLELNKFGSFPGGFPWRTTEFLNQ